MSRKYIIQRMLSEPGERVISVVDTRGHMLGVWQKRVRRLNDYVDHQGTLDPYRTANDRWTLLRMGRMALTYCSLQQAFKVRVWHRHHQGRMVHQVPL
jgi:hypothetical protein